MYLNCLALQSFYINLFICVIGTKKGSVKASGNCIGKQWPLPVTILEKMDGNYVNYEPARMQTSKCAPLQVHKSFKSTWHGFASGSTSGKKGLN